MTLYDLIIQYKELCSWSTGTKGVLQLKNTRSSYFSDANTEKPNKQCMASPRYASLASSANGAPIALRPKAPEHRSLNQNRPPLDIWYDIWKMQYSLSTSVKDVNPSNYWSKQTRKTLARLTWFPWEKPWEAYANENWAISSNPLSPQLRLRKGEGKARNAYKCFFKEAN